MDKPFRKGQIVEDERGIRYRVTRPYVPPEPGYCDLDCFELVRITPPEPFTQAGGLAYQYRPVQGKR